MVGLDVERLADRMRKEVEIDNRMHRLQTYKMCFVGSQAVRWMIRNGLALSVAEALEIGDFLIDHGVFSHVNRTHMFENDPNMFYRFAEDWPSHPSRVTKQASKGFRKLGKTVVHGVFSRKPL